jgi:hypothetical protein
MNTPLLPRWRFTLLLGLAMAVTRFHHAASAVNLPDASAAVFFLAGFYLQSVLSLGGLLALASTIDYLAITAGGVSSFCVSPAYVFLLPAYTSLWLAGRWYAARHRLAWTTLVPLAASAVAGAAACELFSSGGFYFFSGRFTHPTLIEFGTRLAKYFPSTLGAFTFYVALAAAVHTAFALAQRAARPAREAKAG